MARLPIDSAHSPCPPSLQVTGVVVYNAHHEARVTGRCVLYVPETETQNQLVYPARSAKDVTAARARYNVSNYTKVFRLKVKQEAGQQFKFK